MPFVRGTDRTRFRKRSLYSGAGPAKDITNLLSNIVPRCFIAKMRWSPKETVQIQCSAGFLPNITLEEEVESINSPLVIYINP